MCILNWVPKVKMTIHIEYFIALSVLKSSPLRLNVIFDWSIVTAERNLYSVLWEKHASLIMSNLKEIFTCDQGKIQKLRIQKPIGFPYICWQNNTWDDLPYQSSLGRAYILCESMFEQFGKCVQQKKQGLGKHVGLEHQPHLIWSNWTPGS